MNVDDADGEGAVPAPLCLWTTWDLLPLRCGDRHIPIDQMNIDIPK
jgi:hypothetical protein